MTGWDVKRSADELLQAARDGDREARGLLLAMHHGRLVAIARSQLGRRLQVKADAADLAQEACLRALRFFNSFRGGSSEEFATWLRRILASLVANHFRRFLVAGRRNARLERGISQFVDDSDAARFEPVAADSSPIDQAQQLETSLRLEAAVERLPGDYRQVIALRTFEGLSFAEIAQRMGRSVDSVQKLWGRGLLQLRKAIGDPR
jgi:RNA polymerase sigma-70 factor (ECF subfamily)